MPALPLSDAGPYVAAAYLAFVALILIYVAIMAAKLVRIERQVVELNELMAARGRGPATGDPSAGHQSSARNQTTPGTSTATAPSSTAGAEQSSDRQRVETA